MKSTMMEHPLSLNDLLERAGSLFAGNTIVSRLPDKSFKTHTYGQFHRRTRALASTLQKLGLKKGERVATLCWNHHAHLEAYFGIPAAGGVMHTLNLRLAVEEIGWIAGNANDRFLIVDDILLPLYKQFAPLHKFERVIIFPFSGAQVEAGFDDYEALLDTMGRATAWMHLRGAGRQRAANADELVAFAERKGWRRKLLALSADCAAQTRADAAAYNQAYDAGVFQVFP